MRKERPSSGSLKKSARPYMDVQLRPQDSEGYAAAGVLPWRRTSDGQLEILLAREYRPVSRDTAGDKLNFLGGKRLKREVDTLTCAVDKAISLLLESTAHMLSRVVITLILFLELVSFSFLIFVHPSHEYYSPNTRPSFPTWAPTLHVRLRSFSNKWRHRYFPKAIVEI
jgi:hypothetical protein